MLFTFVLTAAAGHSLGMRPEHSALSQTANFAKLGLLAKTARSDPVKALKDAAAAVDSIMLEAGNATEHMSDDDQALLTSVVDLIDKTIYGSMDSSHNADEAAIAGAIADAEQCNSGYAARIAEGGDLYGLQQGAIGFQNVLNGLQDTVDAKTEVNNTKWSELSSHMSMIAAPPACAELPERTKPALDVYFEKSDYVNWYTAQQASYAVVNSAFETNDADLTTALQAYAVGLAQRDTSYCDWKTELEAGCGLFNGCFQSKSDAYLVTLKPALEEDMQARIEAYKAGQTIIAQVNFLLGLSADSAPPSNIDTSRYELQFPPLPAQGSCVLEVMDDAIWVPTVSCAPAGGPGKP